MDSQRRDLAILRFEHFAISRDNEMVLHPAANWRIAAGGRYKEIGRALGPQPKMKIESKSRGIECGTKVSGASRQRQT
jgi:hypothetical protein